MKFSKLALLLLPMFIFGCSDSGDTPTGSGGGSGTTPNISVADVSVDEANNAVVTVTLSAVSSSDVTFDYSTANGSAVSGPTGDFTSASGMTTISAGTLSENISITVNNDSNIEANESFTFSISNISGANLGDGSAVVTIRDNDGISFANDVRPLIQSNGCLSSSCHGSGNSQGGMTLGDGSYSSVRNASGDNGAIIVPNNANASNLYLKLTPNPPFGSRMPFTGSALTTEEQNKIRDWINQGALNN